MFDLVAKGKKNFLSGGKNGPMWAFIYIPRCGDKCENMNLEMWNFGLNLKYSKKNVCSKLTCNISSVKIEAANAICKNLSKMEDGLAYWKILRTKIWLESTGLNVYLSGLRILFYKWKFQIMQNFQLKFHGETRD